MYFLVRIQNTQIFTIKQLSRYICINTLKHNISKQGNFINKLINRNQTNRDPMELIIKTSPCGATKKELSIHTRRRMTVLNKVFMEYITDMMSTGEIEPEILNRNIEIIDIKITADFKFLNIYWIDYCDEHSDTEELLKKCAIQLRHELSQLRVIGNVPPIQFVKDRSIRKLKEVNQKLQTLDFGEDFVPNTYSDAIHYTVTAYTGSDNHEEARNTQHENISQDIFTVSIPVMRHDVFGLDHYQIMSKIKASLSKARVARKTPVTNVHLDSTSTPKLETQNVPAFLIDVEQKEQFSKFLNQRRKEQKEKSKKKFSEANNLICDFEEQNYNDNHSYDNDYENDYDAFTGENNEDIYKSIDDEFKKIR